MRTGRWESEARFTFRVNLPSCAVPPRNDTVVGAHFGRAGQGGPKIEPRRVSRLAKRTAVGEGGWRVSEHG
jgi:hypothetical protein